MNINKTSVNKPTASVPILSPFRVLGFLFPVGDTFHTQKEKCCAKMLYLCRYNHSFSTDVFSPRQILSKLIFARLAERKRS